MQMINSVVFIEKDLNDSKNNAHQCCDQEIIVVFAIFLNFYDDVKVVGLYL
jgi:hypothetical protein